MNFSVFDHLLEGVQVISDDMRYVYLNETVKAQGGISGRNVIGMKCEEIYPGIEESSAFVNIRECIRTGEPINFMNRFDFPDGSVGYFELRMSRIEGGVLLFSVDRTDEMRKEEQIRQANRRYESITESVHSALFEWNLDDQIVFGNAFFHELCTVNIGRKCVTLEDVLSIAGDHQLVEFKYFLDQAIQEKKTNFIYYIENRLSDERAYFSFQLNVVVCYKDDGGVSHYIGYIVDATEERKSHRLRDLRIQINNIFLSDNALEDCLEEVLALITQYSPVFRVAECWLPNYDHTEIRRRAVHSTQGKNQDIFLLSHDGNYSTFKRGTGLPGVCLDQNNLIWWNTLENKKEFKRRELVKKSKLRTGIAIPLHSKNELVAVVTLFSEKDIEMTLDATNQLASLSENIGHGIANKRIAHQRNLLNDNSSILFFNLSPDGGFLRYSKTVEDLFLNGKNTKIKTIFDLIDSNDKEGFEFQWKNLLSGNCLSFSEVFKMNQVSGRVAYLKSSVTRCADDDSVDLIALDISREKQLLDLLSLSNKMASIGFWSIDLINMETILSGNARNLLGIPEDMPIHDLKIEFMKRLMPEVLYIDLINAIKRREPMIDLKWDRLKENENHQFRLIVKTEFNEKHGVRISGVIQDVTSIMKAEAELEIARTNYLDLIDLSPTPIWLQDPDTLKIELANKKACEIYGYTAKEFGKINFDALLIGDDQIKAIEEHRKLLDQGNEVYLGMFKHISKHGNQLFVDNFARKIHFQNKDHLLVIGVDRTEGLELQNQISRAVIQAQEIQKQEISRELHDNICQLMVTSQLYLGMIMDEREGKQLDYLDLAFNLLEKACKETRQLSHNLNSSKFNNQTLNESINEIVESLKFGKGIQISTRLPEDLLDIEDDSDLKLNLVRLVQEALTNTIKHSEASKVAINGKKLTDRLELSISDNGKGFDTSAIKPGIGIYNMQNRVQVYHGEMNIVSSLGKGTEIQIRIPRNMHN